MIVTRLKSLRGNFKAFFRLKWGYNAEVKSWKTEESSLESIALKKWIGLLTRFCCTYFNIFERKICPIVVWKGTFFSPCKIEEISSEHFVLWHQLSRINSFWDLYRDNLVSLVKNHHFRDGEFAGQSLLKERSKQIHTTSRRRVVCKWVINSIQVQALRELIFALQCIQSNKLSKSVVLNLLFMSGRL